jgi:hypothetical protein
MPLNNYCQLAGSRLLRVCYLGIGLITVGLIVFLMFIPIVLCELFEKKDTAFDFTALVRKGTVCLIALMVFLNSYTANVNYMSLYYTNRQVENAVNSIMVQAYQQPGYTTDKKWVFLGKANDNTFTHPGWCDPALLYGGNLWQFQFLPQKVFCFHR